MNKPQWFALAGFLLGWGAPLGALVIRYMDRKSNVDPVPFLQQEWTLNAFYYWYMLVGTCLVLAFVGFLLGRYEAREDERRKERLGS